MQTITVPWSASTNDRATIADWQRRQGSVVRSAYAQAHDADGKPRWSDGGGEPLPGNPNPMRFSILSTVQIGDLHLSVLQYEGCTNFQGRKVLLTTWNPRGRSSIDPHFAEGSGIIARFEPSAAGLSAARVLAEALASGGDGA